jgi:hypothetical protein
MLLRTTEYCVVYLELRRARVVVSQVHMMLAALARTTKLTLLTTTATSRPSPACE